MMLRWFGNASCVRTERPPGRKWCGRSDTQVEMQEHPALLKNINRCNFNASLLFQIYLYAGWRFPKTRRSYLDYSPGRWGGRMLRHILISSLLLLSGYQTSTSYILPARSSYSFYCKTTALQYHAFHSITRYSQEVFKSFNQTCEAASSHPPLYASCLFTDSRQSLLQQ